MQSWPAHPAFQSTPFERAAHEVLSLQGDGLDQSCEGVSQGPAFHSLLPSTRLNSQVCALRQALGLLLLGKTNAGRAARISKAVGSVNQVHLRQKALLAVAGLNPPCRPRNSIAPRCIQYRVISRVFLWALVMGPFDSCGVCSIGPHFVYGLQFVHLVVQIKGPIPGANQTRSLNFSRNLSWHVTASVMY